MIFVLVREREKKKKNKFVNKSLFPKRLLLLVRVGELYANHSNEI
jgi:hypothetical protein